MRYLDVDFLSSFSFTSSSSKCSWNKTFDEKLVGEHPCIIVISIKLLCDIIIKSQVRYITVTPLAACNMANVILPDELLRRIFTNRGCANLDILN